MAGRWALLLCCAVLCCTTACRAAPACALRNGCQHRAGCPTHLPSLPPPYIPTQLHKLCKRPSEPLWAPQRGHQDLEASPGEHCLCSIRRRAASCAPLRGHTGLRCCRALPQSRSEGTVASNRLRTAPQQRCKLDMCPASPDPAPLSCPRADYIPRLRRFLVECWGEEYAAHLRAGGVKL